MARVLVADDEAGVRTVVLRALQLDGHEIIPVADGAGALEALEGAQFDLLLTDIVMPGLDGIALALKAAKLDPEMKIILMTGYADEQHRAHNLEALVNQVLAKPFTVAEIRRVVSETLGNVPNDSR